MEFAENNRISHRQLYLQMVLAFLPPFLLSLYRPGMVSGISGLLGTAIASVGVIFYSIFLIRLAPCMGNLKKTAGKHIGRLLGLFFLSYVILAAVYLLKILEEIVPEILVGGIPGGFISLAAVLVCSMGAGRGMQRRGRIAEVSGRVWMGAILLMLLSCLFQGKGAYVRDMLEYGGSIQKVTESAYGVWCAFSGISLQPFSLEYVERKKSVFPPILLAAVTVGGLVLGTGLALTAVLGRKRLLTEPYPVLPLLAGADLPGRVLARFDVLWLGVLLFGLLFSIGSLLHYGHLVLQKTCLPKGTVWLPAVIWGLSLWKMGGAEEPFILYLKYFFAPAVLLIQVIFLLKMKQKWRKKAAVASFVAGVLCLCGILGGCVGIEPEKRMYPLALGIDVGKHGDLVVTYGVPQLPKAEGQTKSEEGNRALTLKGRDFEEIENTYRDTQEKYLDLGHLQMLVLGKNVRESGRWREVLQYLKDKKMPGEDLYVFGAQDAKKIMNWQGDQGTSVGEYVQGLLENHPGKKGGRIPTLRSVYHGWYENDELIPLQAIRIVKEGLEIEEQKRVP